MPMSGRMVLHQNVGDRVPHFCNAFDACPIDAVAQARKRRADDARVPRQSGMPLASSADANFMYEAGR